MSKPSVKIMLSYDYCHFEVALASDEDMPLKEINELRKDAQRLVDEAVRQYQVAKQKALLRLNLGEEKARLKKEVRTLLLTKSRDAWTAEEKAKVKALEDDEYWEQHNYDYEDDEL